MTAPSSYIPTTDSPVTRAADNVSRTLGYEFNKREGTIVVRISDIEKAKGQALFNLMEAGTFSYGPRIQVAVEMVGAIKVSCQSDTGEISPRSIAPTSSDPTIAISYKAGQPIVYVCDGHVASEYANTSPTNLGELTYSDASDNRSRQMNTSVFSTEYYPYTMTKQELIDLTSYQGTDPPRDLIASLFDEAMNREWPAA